LKKIAALFLLAISFSALAADDAQPNVVKFQGLGWTEVEGGYPKQQYEIENICSRLPTNDKTKRFRDPTKSELLAVLKAKKLRISGQPSKYGIWTEQNPQGRWEPRMRCTLDGACDDSRNEPGATESRSVSIRADVVCVIELGAQAASKDAKRTMAASQSERKAGAGASATLVLTQQSTAATDAKKAKAAADLKKKKDQENKNALVAAKKLADETKAKADKEAARKAEGRVVNQTILADSLEEHLAKTWCARRVPEFRQTMAAGREKLISIGSCSCRPGGAAVALSKQFRCEFPVSFREFSSGAK